VYDQKGQTVAKHSLELEFKSKDQFVESVKKHFSNMDQKVWQKFTLVLDPTNLKKLTEM